MPRRTRFASASVIVAAILTAIGTFKEDDHSVGELLVTAAVAVVAAASVFWVVLPRVRGNPALAALALEARERRELAFVG